MRGDGSIPTAFVPLIANRQALLLATQPRGVGAALPAGRGLWSPASSRPLELQESFVAPPGEQRRLLGADGCPI